MNDNEIIKALEELLEIMLCEGDLQRSATISKSLDLINRQKAEIEKNENIIRLADKTIETANARIEELVGNNDELNIELQSMRSAANSLKMHYKEAQTKIESLKIFRGYAEKRASDYKTMRDKYLNAKSEAAKEFTERIKELIRTKEFTDDVAMLLCAFIDNICKEMAGDDNA